MATDHESGGREIAREPARRAHAADPRRRDRAECAAARVRDLPRALQGLVRDKWMWTPIVLTPPLTLPRSQPCFSERAARTVSRRSSALYCADGLIGIVTHVQRRRQEARRLLGADVQPRHGAAAARPGSLAMVGAFGLLRPCWAGSDEPCVATSVSRITCRRCEATRERPQRAAAPAARDDAADARPLSRLRRASTRPHTGTS